MALSKTAVTPLLMHWSYCSVALSHQYMDGLVQHNGNSIANTPELPKFCTKTSIIIFFGFYHYRHSISQLSRYVAGDASQIRLGSRFRSHWAWHSWHTNCKLFLWRWWEMSGRWEQAGAHWICPMWHGLLWWYWVHNCHLRKSSLQGNRRMAPPQASPDPLWPLSLVCHLLVWPVQCNVYTWSWHQTSDGQGCHCISGGSN